MAILVIGGHSRSVGKTSVVAGLITALPERRWTAVKITQFGHGICSVNGESCDCATDEHTVAISEERDAPAVLTLPAFCWPERSVRCGCGASKGSWPKSC